jgi:hypothetical protein
VARILELKLAELHEMLTSSTASAFVETEADISVVNGAGDLPEDFFRLNAAWVVWSSSDHEPLTNLSNQQYAASYAGSSWTAGASKAFRIVGSQLRVFPAATTATVRVAYVPAFATADEYDGVNGWEKYVTVGAAIEILAIENRTNAALEREYERQSERILSMIEERQAQDAPRIRDAEWSSVSAHSRGGGGGSVTPAVTSLAASAITFASDGTPLYASTAQAAIVELAGLATMEALRAIVPTAGKYATTLSYAIPGDEGGGFWRAAFGSPGDYTHNGGTVIVPSGGNGSAAWLREYDGPIFPEWFGCVGDGATDDKAALAACFAVGGKIQIDRTHLVQGGNLALVSGLRLFGKGAIQVDTSTLNPLFTGTGLSDIRIKDLTLIGNADDQTSDSSGSCAFDLDGCENIKLYNVKATGWTRHGIALDGCENVLIYRAEIADCYHGAGILCASTVVSTDIRVVRCDIRDTQLANVHAYVGVVNWVVEDNYLDGTGAGSGSIDTGDVADNITCYPSDLSLVNASIQRNFCFNSQNHGIHLGGMNLTVCGNIIAGQRSYGTLIAAGGTLDPNAVGAVGLIYSGNRVTSDDRTSTIHKGLSVRNVKGFSIQGNVFQDVYDAFEIRFIDTDPVSGEWTEMGSLCGNVALGVYRYGVELNGDVRGCGLYNNTLEVVDSAGEHIRYNTTTEDGYEDNPAQGNIFLGAGTAPRAVLYRHGTASVPPTIYATGSAASINLAMRAKSNGAILLGNDQGWGAQISASSASTVNRVELAGSATGAAVRVVANGDDTNLDIRMEAKGTGVAEIRARGTRALRASNPSGTVVNWIDVGGSVASSPPGFTAAGSDTNIDLALVPKGTGNVRFGTRTANGDAAITGYLEIKDAGGTVRKLAIID